MARKPRPSELAKKAQKSTSKKKAASPGRKRVTRDEIAAAEADGEAKQATTTKLPPQGFIKKFVSVTLAGLEKESQSAVGDIGSAISVAVEKQHVEKRALSIVRRLHKMPDKKFQETWEHLQDYFAGMGFQERADKQGQLALERASGDVHVDPDEVEAAGSHTERKSRMRVVPKEDEPEQTTAEAMDEAIKADTPQDGEKIASFH